MNLSIIIPVFNEEGSIGKLIHYLKEHDPEGNTEIIVVDGGSTDETWKEASEAGGKVIKSPKKGRASQMNEGAAHANHELLYFLHADTYPPTSYIQDILESVNNGFNAGCYRLAFDLDHPLLSFYSWFTRFDIDLFRFGDQSLFIEKEIFVSIGGYSDQLIVMEDQEIVRTIKKTESFRILDKNVITSARKYQEVGIIKLQAIFALILIMYHLGVPQETLVRFYQNRIKS